MKNTRRLEPVHGEKPRLIPEFREHDPELIKESQ